MSKSTRIDSAEGTAEAMAGARATIDPPFYMPLQPSEVPFFKAIVNNRAAAQWNQADLEIAVHLARGKAMLERYAEQLRIEGPTIINDRGTPIANPLFKVMDTLTRQVLTLGRSLHVHAEATLGSSRDTGGKGRKQREAGERMNEVAEGDADSLIPGLQ